MKKFIFLAVLTSIFQFGFSQSWVSAPVFPGTARSHAATFTIGDTGFVAGGGSSWYLQDVWKFHAGTWTQIASYPNDQTDGVLGFSIGDTGYAGTGAYAGYSYGNTFYKYYHNKWTQIATLPGQGRTAAVAFTIRDTAYVGGGLNGYNNIPLTDFYKYVPSTNKWTAIASCPAAGVSDGAVGFSIGDTGYVGTGSKYNGSTWIPQKDFWKYNPGTNTWKQIASFPAGTRSGAAAFTLCNKAYVGTGDSNSAQNAPMTDFWQYDPGINKWTKIANVGGPAREEAAVFVIADSAYIGGGWGSGINNTKFADYWSYTPLPPSVSLMPSPQAVCSGSSITLQATGEPAYDYLWIGTGNTTDTMTVSPAKDTTYQLKIINGACISDTDIAVTVNPLPAVTFSGNNPICGGDSTIITAAGGNTFSWSNGATTSAIAVKPLTNTTYSVSVNNGTCTKDTMITITVNPLPTVTFSGNASVCEGGSSTITASGGTSYLWSNGATTNNITVTPASTTTYTVSVNDNTCTKDTTFTLIVNPLPSITLSAAKNSVCVNWTKDSLIGIPKGGTYSGAGVTGSNFNPSVAGVGTHSIIYTYTDSAGCSSADTIKLIVNACTGIQEVNGLDNEVTFYPNPFTQSINVNINLNGPITITMFNMLGENVGTWQMEQGQHSISTQSLPAGVYTMQVKTSNGIINKKLIKMN